MGWKTCGIKSTSLDLKVLQYDEQKSFCYPEFAVTESVLQETKDSDKWVVVGRNLGEVTSFSYSSGISYCSIMKVVA